MLRLLVLLVVTAGAVSAQTDADLLARLLAATQPAAPGVIPFGQLTSDLPPAALQAVTDSTSARFLADWQPDHVREALAALERPDIARVAARTALRPGVDEVASLAFGLVGAKTPAADSSLAALYLRATGRSEATLALVERVFRAAAESIPAARADLDRRGQTIDAAVADELAPLAAMLPALDLATARLQLAGLAPADVKAAAAFEQTPAGRYVRATVAEGTARALLPTILDLIRTTVPGADVEGTPDSLPRRYIKVD
ncbi:MAG TPA: hypothetical protein VGB53_00100 [Rubricoccaceae bacterium]|jgi:hypothetical protein